MSVLIKQPSESKVYAIDFANLLDTGDSIDTVTSVESTPAGPTIFDKAKSGTEVRFTVADGTDGVFYTLEAIVETTNGETLEGEGYLYVTDSPETVVSVNNIKVKIAEFLGFGRNTEGLGTTWNTDEEAQLDDILREGARRFYWPAPLRNERQAHRWSFLRPEASLTLTAPYATGTLTIVDGVATLAGGTFPSWAANGILTISTGTFTVASRGSDTEVTLDDTSVDADALTIYSLSRLLYNMPADFGSLEGRFYYSGEGRQRWPVEIRSYGQILDSHSRAPSDSHPVYAALVPKAFDGGIQAWMLAVSPSSDAIYTLFYQYQILPAALDSTQIFPYGSVMHFETLMASCLAAAERWKGLGEQIQENYWQERIVASIEADRQKSPDTLGYCGDPSTPVRMDRNYNVTFDETLYD